MLRKSLVALATVLVSVCLTIAFLQWWHRDQESEHVTVPASTLKATPAKEKPPVVVPQARPSEQKTPLEQKETPPAPDPLPQKASRSYVPPKLISRVEPQNTNSSKLSGTVRLSFYVTANGNVQTIKVIRRLNAELDQNAIKAVSHWHYRPALVDGRPTMVQITDDVKFPPQ